MGTVAEAMAARLRFHGRVRAFFEAEGYCEWQTPLVVPMPGTEANLQYFSCPWRDVTGRAQPMYLRSSPELHLKKVLATTGVERLFELGPCFRNGGELGPWHHPEFTMLEWYRVGADAASMMEETLALVARLAEEMASPLAGSACTDAPVFTVAEAFEAFAGLTLIDEDPELWLKARDQGVLSVAPTDDFETAFFKVLMERVEPALERWPVVFLCDYPPSQAALAAVQGGAAQRFELYVRGVEVSNGFWELRDAEANRQRIIEANSKRSEQGLAPIAIDEEFIDALAEHGLPACSGTALGVDRLQALLSGYDNLDAVLGFRHTFGLQPGQSKNEGKI